MLSAQLIEAITLTSKLNLNGLLAFYYDKSALCQSDKTEKKNEKVDLIEVQIVLDLMVEESDKVVLKALVREDLE